MSRERLSAHNDLSTDELFARVLDDLRVDDDNRLGPLVALHGRPTGYVVERCLALCESVDAYERTVGLQILRELGHQLVDRARLWQPIEPRVAQLVLHDASPDVVHWAISCLGHQPSGPLALAAVLTRANHEDPQVRFAVAAALPSLIGANGRPPEGVAALIALTGDADADVRSYALMGLTLDLEMEDEIRPILNAHLSDPDEQIRRHVRAALDGDLRGDERQ